MRTFFFTTLMLLSTTAFSQENATANVVIAVNETPQATYKGLLPNGNKLFALPQDNMPCIVPKEEGIKIPNSRAGLLAAPRIQTMPNPGLRNKPLIPAQTSPGATVQGLQLQKSVAKRKMQNNGL